MIYMHNIKLEGTPTEALASAGLRHNPMRGDHYLRSRVNGEYHDFDEGKVRSAARQTRLDNQMLILDIEHLKLPEQTSEIERVINWVRDECPGLRVGCYGIMPGRDWYASVDADREASWREDSARHKYGRDRLGRFQREGLSDQVDFVVPSLYTVNRDWFTPSLWEAWAINTIREARDYGKQVYPAIWPEYHRGGKDVGYRLIEPAFWRTQLRTCAEHADGLIIWNATSPVLPRWNSNAEWVRITIEELRGA